MGVSSVTDATLLSFEHVKERADHLRTLGCSPVLSIYYLGLDGDGQDGAWMPSRRSTVPKAYSGHQMKLACPSQLS